MAIDNTRRLLALTTVLGPDVLSPVGFHADEQISAPFSLSVQAVSQSASVDPDALLFNPACLTVTQNDTPRYFHGMVRAVTATGTPIRGMYNYTLSIVPRLWFMAQTEDCRVFQQQTVGDILTTLCSESGQALQLKIFGCLPTLEYVTQYNESDLLFATRLMEQAGLFYFFTCTDSDHTLVVTDNNQGFPASPKPTRAVVHVGNNFDTLCDWRQLRATAAGSLQLMDYDPANPSPLPDATTATTLPTAGAAKRDVMRWPALTVDPGTVTARTKFGIEAAEAEVSLTDAAGSDTTMTAGARFTLLRDPFTGTESVDYIVRAVAHHGTDDTWVAGAGESQYTNSITVFPASVTWRQRLTAQRPQMAGIFGGIVLGDQGEEIHADSMGRIKVQLFWDRRQDTVADKGVWVRVIQPWAGNNWGWQHLPRVGTEVAVAFMDGDPDRPVVVGGFYNANMATPFAVPDEQTKSGFRSRSSLNGGTSNFSEFSIDDKKGNELVYLHAEKDMTREVENNDSLTVSNTQTITIAKGRAETVSDGGDTISVTGGRNTTIQTKGETLTVAGGRTTTIQDSGDALTVQSGDLTISVSSGAASVEAMQSITLTVGSNSITIDPSGVTIKGTMVQIQGQAMVQVTGPMVQVNADGMAILKGGIVMVN
jgi:type VI secretion system secreted protein VgrG